MAKGKQLVYRYDGDANSEEVEQDLFDEMPIPKEGEVIERKGRRWTVSVIQITQSVTHPAALPVHRIFLTKTD